jgi:hypothetical protein
MSPSMIWAVVEDGMGIGESESVAVGVADSDSIGAGRSSSACIFHKKAKVAYIPDFIYAPISPRHVPRATANMPRAAFSFIVYR